MGAGLSIYRYGSHSLYVRPDCNRFVGSAGLPTNSAACLFPFHGKKHATLRLWNIFIISSEEIPDTDGGVEVEIGIGRKIENGDDLQEYIQRGALEKISQA